MMTGDRAFVAQLDRATGFEPVGRGFESLRARQCFACQAGPLLQREAILQQQQGELLFHREGGCLRRGTYRLDHRP
jgi:hypothetical protein